MQCSGDQGFSVRDSFQPEADASIRESPSHVSAAASPYEPRPTSGGGSLLPPCYQDVIRGYAGASCGSVESRPLA